MANGYVGQQVIHSGSKIVSISVSKSANKSIGQSNTSQLITYTVNSHLVILPVIESVSQSESKSVSLSVNQS